VTKEIAIELETECHQKLCRRADQTGFKTPEQYAQTIIETVLAELEMDSNDEAVRERLEDLGYL
jgi:predicted DNA-binding protein